MESRKFKLNKKTWLLALLIIIIGFSIYGGAYFMESYSPDEMALTALSGSETVKVEETDDYIRFTPLDGEPDQPGLLYYQGAKVKSAAYAVMGKRLAEAGIPVIIAKMPVNFAIFDVEKAIELKKNLDLPNIWAIGGHSLGGAMAAKVVYDNPAEFSALILFASYPSGKNNDLSKSDLKVLSLWGTNDAFVTQVKIDEKKPFLPVDTTYVRIEGGNHSQFGNYGFQKGDNEANLSYEEQMDQIVEAIVEFMK